MEFGGYCTWHRNFFRDRLGKLVKHKPVEKPE
jgi:hypothetical protein